MKIIVVGAGEVGFHLAKMLSNENHDIVIIEDKQENCLKAQENLDIIAIQGNGASIEKLIEAGVRDSDMLIAVSNSDEVNIVSCILANKFGVEKKVARVRNPEYTSKDALITPEQLGIDMMIHPEEEAAAEIIRLIKRSSATDVIDYKKEGVQILGIRIDSRDASIVGKPLNEVTKEFSNIIFRTVAIYRNGRTIIPKGKDLIFYKDQIFIIAKVEYIHSILKLVGKEDEKINSLMILGGGKIGRLVATELEKMKDIDIKLIESDREKSQIIADQLNRTLVIQGDGTDIDLLATEGLSDMDAFVALTNDDEDNLISSLLAKHLGVKRVLALINKFEYIPIINSIGLDAAVSEKVSTIDAILRFIRRGKVISVATLKEIDAEVMEIVAQEGSPIANKQLKEIGFPNSAIVGAIFRDNEVIIPVGTSRIEPNDKVIVFALPEAISKVEKYFS